MSAHLVKLGDESAVLGKFIIVWREDSKTVAEVKKFYDDTDGRRMVFRLVEGVKKGEENASLFSKGQEVKTYDDMQEAIDAREFDAREYARKQEECNSKERVLSR